VRRALADGYELDDDPERVDRDALLAFLNEHSYWARERTREQLDRALDASARQVGLYRDGAMVGFARAVSDEVTFAYLADVYVLQEHRGGGRGVELVREAVEGAPFENPLWVLRTSDAHGLYEKLGFRPGGEDELLMWRARRVPSGP
jgi:GNAT superfamily N-acetyltransferase